jgi:hypothetical protein
MFQSSTYIDGAGKVRRKSSFHELLDDADESPSPEPNHTVGKRPSYNRALSKIAELQSPRRVLPNPFDSESNSSPISPVKPSKEPLEMPTRAESAPPSSSKYPLYTRLWAFGIVLTVLISLAQSRAFPRGERPALPDAEGAIIPRSNSDSRLLAKREDTNVDRCKRWSQQSMWDLDPLGLYTDML